MNTASNTDLVVIFTITAICFFLIYAGVAMAMRKTKKKQTTISAQQIYEPDILKDYVPLENIPTPKESINEYELESESRAAVKAESLPICKVKQSLPEVKLKTKADLDRFEQTKLFEVISCGKTYMLTEKQLFFYDKIKSLQKMGEPARGKDVATAFTVEKYKHLSVSEFKKLPKWKFKTSPHVKTIRGLQKAGLISKVGTDGFVAY